MAEDLRHNKYVFSTYTPTPAIGIGMLLDGMDPRTPPPAKHLQLLRLPDAILVANTSTALDPPVYYC